MASTAQKIRAYEGPVLFERGFRPFFWSAGIFAGIVMPLWILVLVSDVELLSNFSGRDWHIHEMIFGYIPAVFAGFLLTAIPNWTGRLPVIGWPLAILWVLWLSGRIVIAFSEILPTNAAIVDSGFLVGFALLIWREIIAGKNVRNIPICIIVSMFALMNMAFHYQHLAGNSTAIPERFALGLTALLLSIVGGRITPSFTSNWMRGKGLNPLPASIGMYDKLVIAIILFTILSWVGFPENAISGWLFLVAALASVVRLSRWRGFAVFSEPLLFILHVGMAWVSLWFIGMAAAILMPELFDQNSALHALTAGAVGTMTLAVMTRASLGHSGRALKAGPGAVAIFVFVTAGSIVRIVANWLPFDYITSVSVAGILWSMAFLLFVILWTPILITKK